MTRGPRRTLTMPTRQQFTEVHFTRGFLGGSWQYFGFCERTQPASLALDSSHRVFSSSLITENFVENTDCAKRLIELDGDPSTRATTLGSEQAPASVATLSSRAPASASTLDFFHHDRHRRSRHLRPRSALASVVHTTLLYDDTALRQPFLSIHGATCTARNRPRPTTLAKNSVPSNT